MQKAEKGGFPLFGSKTCSTERFRLFWVQKSAQQGSFAVLGFEHSILHIWDSKTFRPLFQRVKREVVETTTLETIISGYLSG